MSQWVNCHVEGAGAEQGTCGWQLATATAPAAAAFLELTASTSSAFFHLYVDWKNLFSFLFFSFFLNKKIIIKIKGFTILIGIWLSSGRPFFLLTPFFLSSPLLPWMIIKTKLCCTPAQNLGGGGERRWKGGLYEIRWWERDFVFAYAQERDLEEEEDAARGLETRKGGNSQVAESERERVYSLYLQVGFLLLTSASKM